MSYIRDFDITEPEAPLLWCIGEIIHGGSAPLDLYLPGTIGGDDNSVAGGEGWTMFKEIDNDGRVSYYAWVDPFMFMNLAPNEGNYDEVTVKFYFRQALENLLKEQPNRKAEVSKIFETYDLKPNKEE